MVFITFHGKDGTEYKLKLDAIIGFTTYPDGSHAVIVFNEVIFVVEDWDYFTDKMRELGEAQQRAIREQMLANNISRKYNGGN